MDALLAYYDQETIDKLERLAKLTSYMPHTSFEHTLNMLRFCAAFLVFVQLQAESYSLETPADIVPFAFGGLDIAGEAFSYDVDLFFGKEDSFLKLFHYIQANSYFLTPYYFERREKIMARGKVALLARFSTRFAERKAQQ